MRRLFTLLLLVSIVHTITTQAQPCNILPPQESITLVGDCEIGIPFCINVSPTALLDGDYTLLDNSFPYNGATGNCNYANEPRYNLSSIANEPGDYELINWPVNGGSITSAGPFGHPNDLVDSMNAWMPQGNWSYDSFSKTISGSATGDTYGDMVLKHIASGVQTNIPVEFNTVPYGTEIYLTEGNHELTLINNLGGCEDTLLVIIECPPFEMPDKDTLITANCNTDFYCVEDIYYDKVVNDLYSIHINGQQLTGTYNPCEFKDLITYRVDNLPGNAPYELYNWLIDGNVNGTEGSFTTLKELVALMNVRDPDGNWTLIDVNKIGGYNPAKEYGSFFIRDAQDNSDSYPPVESLSGCGVRFELGGGTHQVVMTDNDTGYSDTTEVLVECAHPPFDLVDEDTVYAVNCEPFEYCVKVPLSMARFDSVDIFVDGTKMQFTSADGCNLIETTLYDFSTHFNNPPFNMDWSVGGNPVSGSFNTIYELAALMNNLDPGTGWYLNGPNQIYTTSIGTYSSIQYSNSLGNSATSPPTPFNIFEGSKIVLDHGVHNIVVVHNELNYTDQSTITVESANPPINLTVNPINITACSGDTIQLNAIAEHYDSLAWTGENVLCPTCPITNAVPLSAQEYKVTAYNCEGDSAFALVHVTVNPDHFVQIYEEVCEGQSFEYNGRFYTQTTADTFYFQNTFGCDSTVFFDINFLPIDSVIVEEIVCNIDLVGTHEEYFQNQHGCDSVVTFVKSYWEDGDTTFVEMLACDQNEVGDTTEYFTNVEGCDSIVVTQKIFGDSIPPIAICKDVTIQLSASGFAYIVVEDVNGGSYDECGEISFDLSRVEFTCQDLGDNEVILYVVDQLGNMDTCTAIVTLIDIDTPFVDCHDITVSLPNNEITDINEDMILAQSFDNCESVTFTLDQYTFDCTQTGINVVTLTAIDQSGNIGTCSATVEVIGETDEPTIVEDYTCDPNEVGSITETFTNQFGCDSLVTYNTYMQEADTTFVEMLTCDQNEVGDTTEYFTNIEGCDSIVVTQKIFGDSIPPIAICKDVTIQLSASGFAYIAVEDVNGGSYDECGEISFDLSRVEFTCQDLGDNEVILYVVDQLGNMDTCLAIVTVIDVDAPFVDCHDITVSLPNNEITDINEDMILAQSFDNCESVTFTLDQYTFDCTQTGINVVTLTAIDQSGNIGTCSATVEVIGETDEPTIVETTTCDSTQVGTNTVTLINQFGCDSLVTYQTYFTNEVDSLYFEEFTCDSLEAGLFVEETTTAEGCPKVITTHVLLLDSPTPTYIDIYTCDSTMIGSTTEHFQSASGCDSIVITNVHYEDFVETIYKETYTCDSTAAGTFTEVTTTPEGCQQEVITTVILHSSGNPTVIEITTCDSSLVGTVIETYPSAAGCDSTVIYETYYVNQYEDIYREEYTCDSTAVGTFTEVQNTPDGCTQNVITNVILITADNPVVVEIKTCDQDKVGTETVVLTSSEGCDSTVIYETIFEPLPVVYIETTSCDPDDVGDFTEVYQTSYGCDSVVVFHVTQEDCSGPISLNGIPVDITLPCGEALPLVPNNIYAESPNCPGTVNIDFTQQTEPNGDCAASFIVERKWIATDACGNQVTKIQIITITDDIAPVFVDAPQDIVVHCTEVIASPQITANDNCDTDVEVNFNETKVGCDLIRTWVAIDDCGNETTHTQYVTIIDTEAPMLSEIPQDTTIHATFGEDIPNPTVLATDNCDHDVEVRMEETETLVSAGYLLTRRWIAIDDCGNEAISEEQVITVIGGPIWPGDTDSTYQVDIFDLFNIGFGFNQTGAARNQPTTNWVAQYAPMWDGYSPINHVNFRHADTNGDGIVNFADVIPLLENYGQVHDFGNDLPIPIIRNQFEIKLETARVTADGWATVDILLENDQQLIQDFYGINFTFLFDQTKIVENTMSINFDDSWAGTINEDLIMIEKELHNEGKFEAAIVRTNQQGINGYGKIGSIKFKLMQNTGGEFRFKLEESIKINSQGTGETSAPEVVDVDLTVTNTRDLPQLDHHLSLYPNPAGVYVHISIDENVQPELLSIFDINGKLILQQPHTENEVKLDVENIPAGIYFLHIQSPEGVMMKKLTIVR